VNIGIPALFNQPTTKSLELSLNATAARQGAIGNNIANLNTPKYRRVDLSTHFEGQFREAMKSMNGGTVPTQIPKASITESRFQNPEKLDGNTVNLDQEIVALQENAAMHEFATKMLSKNYNSLNMAITGRTSQ